MGSIMWVLLSDFGTGVWGLFCFQLVESGGADLILQVCNKDTGLVQEAAMWVLAALATNDRLRVPIAAGGGLRLMCNASCAGQADLQVRTGHLAPIFACHLAGVCNAAWQLFYLCHLATVFLNLLETLALPPGTYSVRHLATLSLPRGSYGIATWQLSLSPPGSFLSTSLPLHALFLSTC